MIFFALMITGFASWITYGNKNIGDSDLIIFREKIPNAKSDYFMTFGRFLILISFIIFGGLRINPMKPMIFKAL